MIDIDLLNFLIYMLKLNFLKNQMSQPFAYSKIKRINRKINIIRIHTDSEHAVIYKLFPTCNISEKISEEDYRRFHLRFYLPASKLIDKDSHINQLILMFNGLNEIEDCTLYDQFGYKFATAGISSVLFPLPDHFNRHSIFRYSSPTPEQCLKPFDILKRNPIEMYSKYIQYMQEIDFFLKHIWGEVECKDEHCDFFRRFFDKNTRISCLGYSLGGLAALANFLANKEKYNACTILFSGIRLEDMVPDPIIPIDEWKRFLTNLHNDFKKAEIANKYYDYFNQIFLGGQTIILREELKEYSRKLIFILGGRDSLIPFSEISKIEDREHGLAIFKIPGVTHFLSKDPDWIKWADFIIDLIIQYEKNAIHKYITKIEAVKKFLELDKKYNITNFSNPFDPIIISKIEKNDKEELRNVQYAIMAYFKSLKEFLEFTKKFK